ncbi:MAG: hypothetical protein NTU49_06805 [Gammaproteobacteria bacterium]|nr:hypothetical protein [Gammaproteobacteria bacterium]
MLAAYYIKRANQYHSVIELNAGTIVNLVFLNKFLLTPHVNQSAGAIVTSHSSNNYWKNSGSQNNSFENQGIQNNNQNSNSLSYDGAVNSNQASTIQNQINQSS